MKKTWLSLWLLIAVTIGSAPPARGDDGTIFTLWPLVDYRASDNADYASFHLLGPLFKYETKGDETEFALRPFIYRASDTSGVAQTEVLYPLSVERSQPDADSLDILHLLNFDFGARESGSSNQFYLFPFLFYGNDPEQGEYAAFFPLGGTLLDWFGRDRISFVLFPLYSRTERGSTVTDNVFWPIFSSTTGENESGFAIWPLYGQSSKKGAYRKQFFLWPIFFDEEKGLDTGQPKSRFAIFPLWVEQESPDVSQRTVLWPFFSWTQDRAKEYEQWDAPWPLVRVTNGTSRDGFRLLPLYSDETVEARRKRWFLWPIYQIEDIHTELLDRQRHRILLFLYSDRYEKNLETSAETRRIDFWPLFSYHRENGVGRFNTLALLEPLFPNNQAIERSWSPLWRIYQQRWDEQGNLVISVLWNLYWHERQGSQKALELFPLFDYRQTEVETKLRLLKGLVTIRNAQEKSCLSLFYLPWEVCQDAGREPGPGQPAPKRLE